MSCSRGIGAQMPICGIRSLVLRLVAGENFPKSPPARFRTIVAGREIHAFAPPCTLPTLRRFRLPLKLSTIRGFWVGTSATGPIQNLSNLSANCQQTAAELFGIAQFCAGWRTGGGPIRLTVTWHDALAGIATHVGPGGSGSCTSYCRGLVILWCKENENHKDTKTPGNGLRSGLKPHEDQRLVKLQPKGWSEGEVDHIMRRQGPVSEQHTSGPRG